MSQRLTRALFLGIAFPALALGGSWIVPPDADLAGAADAIVVATVLSSQSRVAGATLRTDHALRIDEVLKGNLAAGSALRLTTPGGSVGDIAMIVTTEPRIHAGEQAVLFLAREEGDWRLSDGELGKFNFVRDAQSRLLLVRGAEEGEIFGWDLAGNRHIEPLRDAERFLSWIRAAGAGVVRPPDYFLEPTPAHGDTIDPMSHGSSDQYMLKFTGGKGARWPSGGFTMESLGTQPGVSNLSGAISSSRGAWNGHSDSSINISYGGAASGGTYADNEEPNLIFFNQPNSGPLSGTVVGQASLWAITSINNNQIGEDFYTPTDCDIVIETGLTGSLFEEVLAHEMGHCLGFDHAPVTTALMWDNAGGNSISGANLGPWDREAANHVYGNGTVGGGGGCTAPAITSQPPNRTISSGQTANLSVTATGTAPLTYQWFQGGSPTSGTPIGGATSSSFTTPPLTATQTYSVRVTGCEGNSVNSSIATVTVSCPLPSISSQPQSSAVESGQSVTLSVSAGNATSFQWYRGSRGDTSSPISGATGTSVNSGPITSTSRFWVRVTNSCGSTDSQTATISVCQPARVGSEPADATVVSGQGTTLSVAATGSTPVSFQWFRGSNGTTTNPISGATSNSLITGPLTATSTFWVRVSNACGSDDSRTVTVTVLPACVAPLITGNPAPTSVEEGGVATLSVAAIGTSLQYQWYRGEKDDLSQPVSGANSAVLTTPPLAAAERFWARVFNSCGEARSESALVSVGCDLAIAAHPESTRIRRGNRATLTVEALGTGPLTYQWYRGQSGDASSPVAGATGTSFMTPPITATSSFWVRVTSSCGSVDSATAEVSIPERRRGARRG